MRRKGTSDLGRTAKQERTRYLGLDLSLSPGIAVIDLIGRTPRLVYASSLATKATDNDAVRHELIHAFITQVTAANRPIDVVVREDFTAGRNKRATQAIFNAWAAADRALHTFGYTCETVPILSPTKVKKLVTGNGKAEKDEVAASVIRRLYLDPAHTWRSGYDDSDACAVVLAYLIEKGLIDP